MYYFLCTCMSEIQSRKKASCNNNICNNYIYIYINFVVTYKHYLLIENILEDTKLLTDYS